MLQCLRIVFSLEKIPKNFLQAIRQDAQRYNLEGTAQIVEANTIKIAACGKLDDVEAFVDLIHQSIINLVVGAIEIEPFLRQKDYRGVFRVIE